MLGAEILRIRQTHFNPSAGKASQKKYAPPGIVLGPPEAAWLWRENHNWNKIREKLFRNKNNAKTEDPRQHSNNSSFPSSQEQVNSRTYFEPIILYTFIDIFTVKFLFYQMLQRIILVYCLYFARLIYDAFYFLWPALKVRSP